ncbi:MAG: hypothetical protein ACOC0P_06030 [Planctomycetota bacterium]
MPAGRDQQCIPWGGAIPDDPHSDRTRGYAWSGSTLAVFVHSRRF